MCKNKEPRKIKNVKKKSYAVLGEEEQIGPWQRLFQGPEPNQYSHQVRPVFMYDGTKGKSVSEWRWHVFYFHMVVTRTFIPDPVS